MGLRKEDFYSPSQVMVHPDGDVELTVLKDVLWDITQKELPKKHPVRIRVRHVRADSDPDFPEVREAWERTTVGGLFQLYRQVTRHAYLHNPDRFIGEPQMTLGWEWQEYRAYLALERRAKQETRG